MKKTGQIHARTIQQFKEQLIMEEKSALTVEKYVRDVRAFTDYVGDRIVTKQIVLDYKEKIRSDYAVRSVNSMLAALNRFFVFCGWDGCKVKPLKLQKQIYCSPEKELTKAECRRLLNAADSEKQERLAMIIRTISATGIRISELPYITLEAVKKGEALVFCKSKTRVVFIIRSLQKKLLQYARKNHIKSGMIFVTKKGNAVDRSNIWREMKRLCERAGVQPGKLYPHNLRHLFARAFYDMEKDIAKLADLLGHRSINTTRIYIMSSGREHRDKMEQMRMIM